MVFVKGLRSLLLILLAVYALYVVAIAIFFNTGVFAQVAGMENEDQTYVRFKSAYSPFPGIIYSENAKIVISDQNVFITVVFQHARISFSFLPFLHKTVQVDELYAKTAQVDIKFKSESDSLAYQKKYTVPEDLDLKLREKIVKEAEKSHIILNFERIDIGTITDVTSALGDFKGNIALSGGFMIQPKVQAEIYPTTLKFISGDMATQFSTVTGEAKVQIDRFRMIDAPGNAVFPYFNANLNIDVGLKSLTILDLTLKKLPGYGFEGADARASLRLAVKKGKIQPGSEMVTTPTELYIKTPKFKATGFGRVRWDVIGKDTSQMEAILDHLKIRQNAGAELAGTVKRADLKLKIFGIELIDAFQGIFAQLNMKSIVWKVDSGASKNPNLKYQGTVSGDGMLAGFSGKVPASERKRFAEGSDLKLKIDHLDLETSFFPKIDATGDIDVHANPVDLSENAIALPKLDVHLDMGVGKFGQVKTTAKFTHMEHHLYPDESWKGQLDWTMDQTDALVDALEDRGQVSSFLGGFAKVKNFHLKMDCEVGEQFTWLHFNEINSSGIWKAYGTLMNREEGLRGAFETHVLGLPVGVRIKPQKTDVKFFPSAAWYDESQQAIKPPVP